MANPLCRREACSPFFFFRGPLRMQVRDVEKTKPSCHQSRYRRWLDSRQMENYVNVCSNNKMQLNTLICQ